MFFLFLPLAQILIPFCSSILCVCVLLMIFLTLIVICNFNINITFYCNSNM